MSLDLDKRQRAMLREMGVRVWQPQTAPAAVAEMVHEPALAPRAERMDVQPVASRPAETAPVTSPAPARPASVQSAVPAANTAAASWRMGSTHSLYGETAHAESTRWLVLVETPAAAMGEAGFHPLDGEAGKLLDNMFKAARLNQAGAVSVAPLARLAASGGAELQAALPALITAVRPDVVLVMGRLAAQALLQSTEPLGRLRGQVHPLHGAPLVVTYDATFLMRNPADKGRAWDDLCLAMSVARQGAHRT
ncbi:MAG: uracil-DNA glycosylase family protein [Polaromonas sp.]|nr:uracil-DNA glycosylase family protein [Polaromonas sp.]